MRRIKFTEPNDPEWDEWQERCETARDRLVQAFEAGQELVIDRDLYKEQKLSVYMNRDKPFRGKCAYCESDLSRQYGDIEHYRPSSNVTDADRKSITRIRNGQEEKHPGYYWLTYEWSNLLPGCIMCNRPSKKFTEGRLIGKWDRFPIGASRAWHHNDNLAAEDPLIINPVKIDPPDHLIFDKNGSILWASEHGEATVKILGLNDNGLPYRRKEKYDQVRFLTDYYIFLAELNPQSQKASELFNLLRRIKDGYGEFTTYALMAIEDSYKEVLNSIRYHN